MFLINTLYEYINTRFVIFGKFTSSSSRTFTRKVAKNINIEEKYFRFKSMKYIYICNKRFVPIKRTNVCTELIMPILYDLVQPIKIRYCY